MERLAAREVRGLLNALRRIYEIRSLDVFPAQVVSVVPHLVRAKITSYNEVDPGRNRVAWVWNPGHALHPEGKAIFQRHAREHPLIAWYQRTRDGRALKISDFLTRTKFHRLALYNEFYRRVGVEHQMAVALPAPPHLVIGIALNRGRPDFSEKDRLLLNLLRPHLVQAYRNAEALTEMQQGAGLAWEAIEAMGRGAIVLGQGGRIRLMTTRARGWLAEYFGQPARRGDRLPEAVSRWVRHQESPPAGHEDAPEPRRPLAVEREGRRLEMRLLPGPERLVLLLKEQTGPNSAVLERLGLTRREAEALAWVAQGKTNPEIGIILGASPRTVGKHLERIYQKLGVENRTAAAAVALDGPPPE